MQRRNFTKSWIASLPFTPEEFQDTEVPQLRLRVGKRSKTFCVVRKSDGKFIRVPLGDATLLNPAVVRDQARGILGLIGSGHDPRMTKISKSSDLELSNVWRDYKSAKQLKPTTVRGYQQLHDTALKGWQHQPLTAITWVAIRDKHRQLGRESGEAYANAAMRFLRLLFNFARLEYLDDKSEPLVKDNPVTRLSLTKAWYKRKRRQSYIRKSDLAPWFRAVCKLSNDVHRDYLLTALLTGMRRTEISLMRPRDVDLADRSFTLPDTKSRLHRLPMGEYLYKVIERRLEFGGEWLFEGRKGGPLHDARISMRRVTAETGISFTMHDLRRTFTTVAESLELSPYVLKRLLNHEIEGDVTGGYIVPTIERLREPIQRIESALMADFVKVAHN